MLCYCKSEKPFSECCEPILADQSVAKTAEALMRSRYTAFVMANVDYLERSQHVSTRIDKEEKESTLEWTKSVDWMGLQIVSTRAGLEADVEGWVEFKATYIEDGELECIHENSYFVKEAGLWYYQSGVHQ
ncbi:MAG: YchJ family metal-binding protein [Bacteroidales bacterium]|jgi:SEC-C motif-containing protein|nr:YchJ family metal-binding protein [Bacteroidales bacterium]